MEGCQICVGVPLILPRAHLWHRAIQRTGTHVRLSTNCRPGGVRTYPSSASSSSSPSSSSSSSSAGFFFLGEVILWPEAWGPEPRAPSPAPHAHCTASLKYGIDSFHLTAGHAFRPAVNL